MSCFEFFTHSLSKNLCSHEKLLPYFLLYRLDSLSTDQLSYFVPFVFSFVLALPFSQFQSIGGWLFIVIISVQFLKFFVILFWCVNCWYIFVNVIVVDLVGVFLISLLSLFVDVLHCQICSHPAHHWDPVVMILLLILLLSLLSYSCCLLFFLRLPLHPISFAARWFYTVQKFLVEVPCASSDTSFSLLLHLLIFSFW